MALPCPIRVRRVSNCSQQRLFRKRNSKSRTKKCQKYGISHPDYGVSVLLYSIIMLNSVRNIFGTAFSKLMIRCFGKFSILQVFFC